MSETSATTSDYELTQAIAQGTISGIGDLYERHRTKVYSLCLRMTGNVSEAEDLTQEIFLHLLRKAGSFRGESQFSTWLYRFTTNHVLMHFRTRTRRNQRFPYLLDEIARSFPGLRIVIAQLGQPWVDETICMLAKHPHVYADVSGLLNRPWQAYNALVSVYQHGVIDKLLFGSDFPYTSATECIEALYSINQLAQGTNLPLVPREALRGIVERDTLGLLGLS